MMRLASARAGVRRQGSASFSVRGVRVDNNAATQLFHQPLPTGTQAGDLLLAVVMRHVAATTTQNAWFVSNGWTTSENGIYGGNGLGLTYARKVLTSGDIATGYVAWDFGEATDADPALIAIAHPGATAPTYEVGQVTSFPVSTATSTTATAVSAGDIGVYIAWCGNSSTISLNRGTVRVQRTADTNTACVLATEVLASAGTVSTTATFSPSAGTPGVFNMIIVARKT